MCFLRVIIRFGWSCLVHPGVRDTCLVSDNPWYKDVLDRQMYNCVSTLKYTFSCVYWWDKKIPDSAEPRLDSFHPPFVAGIDLSHQGAVDSYNLGLYNFCRDMLPRIYIRSDKLSDLTENSKDVLCITKTWPLNGPLKSFDQFSEVYLQIYFVNLAQLIM